MTGHIQSLRADKGFGFIRSDEDRRGHFFHLTQLKNRRWNDLCDDFDGLQEGEKIEVVFDLGMTDHGEQCLNVYIADNFSEGENQ